MERALREAKLRLAQACVEDIDYPARRELDKAVVRSPADNPHLTSARSRSAPA